MIIFTRVFYAFYLLDELIGMLQAHALLLTHLRFCCCVEVGVLVSVKQDKSHLCRRGCLNKLLCYNIELRPFRKEVEVWK